MLEDKCLKREEAWKGGEEVTGWDAWEEVSGKVKLEQRPE